MASYDPFALKASGCEQKKPPAWFELGKSLLTLTFAAGADQEPYSPDSFWINAGSETSSTRVKRNRPVEAVSTTSAGTSDDVRAAGRSETDRQVPVQEPRNEPKGPGCFFPPPIDDRVLCVCAFIARNFTGPDIEIEAKLGTVIDLSTRERAVLPGCATAACLQAEVNNVLRFESKVSFDAFKRLNEVLNRTVASAVRHRGPLVRHSRSRQTDLRFSSGYRETRPWSRSEGEAESGTNATQGNDKTPASFMFKTRLETLHILFPSHPYDVRVNAAREQQLTPAEAVRLGDARGVLESERLKDRLSYRCGELSIDITVVHLPRESLMTYEVEVELIFDNRADQCAELVQVCTDYRQRLESAAPLAPPMGPSPPALLVTIAETLFNTLVALNNVLASITN